MLDVCLPDKRDDSLPERWLSCCWLEYGKRS